MPAPTKHTPADRALVLKLHAEGKGRNDIQRATSFAASWISKVVADAGLTFERGAEVAAATAAKNADNKTKRAILIGRLYEQATKGLDRLDAPLYKTTLKASGGAEQVRELDFIPAADRRSELTTVAIALDKALVLEKVDGDNGAERAESVLDRLQGGLNKLGALPGGPAPIPQAAHVDSAQRPPEN